MALFLELVLLDLDKTYGPKEQITGTGSPMMKHLEILVMLSINLNMCMIFLAHPWLSIFPSAWRKGKLVTNSLFVCMCCLNDDYMS